MMKQATHALIAGGRDGMKSHPIDSESTVNVSALDAACRQLRAIADGQALSNITLRIGSDGTVAVYGETYRGTHWHAEADVGNRDGDSDGSLARPSQSVQTAVKLYPTPVHLETSRGTNLCNGLGRSSTVLSAVTCPECRKHHPAAAR